MLLGLYRRPPEPIEVTVTITIPAESAIPPEATAVPRPDTPRASLRTLPAPPGTRWLAGDFHAHSTHSDGEQSLAELAALAAGNGLDFLAVTGGVGARRLALRRHDPCNGDSRSKRRDDGC
ncbi:hypothetical protein [Agromyces bauzanensis]|uniref:Uncharacterized protein n=1 Tax=Agromyces bauzanensis TaxID=1308924 RepID=A0A917UU38_9MICO|nr:hypothetical protein [Agromyces bauzanensis]GGJ85236.1 hypothetical protein GCM10011372_24400 [Agromyces bauzanensis]